MTSGFGYLNTNLQQQSHCGHVIEIGIANHIGHAISLYQARGL